MPVKGGYDDTYKDTFGKSFAAGAEVAEEDVRALQGIIPDLAVNAQDCDAGPFPDPNPLVGRKILFEHKTLASLLISVPARARKILIQKARERARRSTPWINLCA